MTAPTLVQDAGLPQATIIDSSVANTQIVCMAQPGTASSAAAWQIQKIVTVGAIKTITWAGSASTGYGKYDQVADNRLTTVTYA